MKKMDVCFDYNCELKVSCQSSGVNHEITGFCLVLTRRAIASSQMNTNTSH